MIYVEQNFCCLKSILLFTFFIFSILVIVLYLFIADSFVLHSIVLLSSLLPLFFFHIFSSAFKHFYFTVSYFLHLFFFHFVQSFLSFSYQSTRFLIRLSLVTFAHKRYYPFYILNFCFFLLLHFTLSHFLCFLCFFSFFCFFFSFFTLFSLIFFHLTIYNHRGVSFPTIGSFLLTDICKFSL